MSHNKQPQSTSSTDEPTHKVVKTPGLTAQSKYIIENVQGEEKRTMKSVLS